jgi:AraC-like DNA-binding protein
MARRTNRKTDLERLSYRPAAPYPYDLEIFRVSDLKRRTHEERMRRTYKYECHMLVCVTEGECAQLVDFTPVSCEVGTLLTVRPGQAHNFGCDENWDGWIVLFRPEFLLPASSRELKHAVDFERLPNRLCLDPDELRRTWGAIERMRDDARIYAPSEDTQSLLRHQLYALVAWLGIIHAQRQADAALPSRALLRFARFQALVEQHFTEWTQVADYAQHLGCTEKSLTRAAVEVVGVSAKTFISDRIGLEAKRLLAHTDLPIGAIATKLGFEEATYFSKFFKREANSTPAEFRLQHATVNLATTPETRGDLVHRSMT